MRKTVAFSKHAANVFFHILTRCNLSCRHCYINPDQHGHRTLPIETIESWLAVLAAQAQRANIIFLGGEPTLHPDLAQAVKAARALQYQSVTIDTNGYLFHDILRKVSPQEVDYFSFSLDGATRRTNDQIRGQGSYAACLKGLTAARQKGFKTSLIYTVSDQNMHELTQMGPLLKDLQVDRFFIQVIGMRGQSVQDPDRPQQVSREEWLAVVPKMAQEVANLGISVTFPKVFLKQDEPFECAGLVADNYFVFPNGRVYRCPLCEDYPLHSLEIGEHQISPTPKVNEQDLFQLQIPEGCVMNKLIQPDNLVYLDDGAPAYQIACCLLKEEVSR